LGGPVEGCGAVDLGGVDVGFLLKQGAEGGLVVSGCGVGYFARGGGCKRQRRRCKQGY
jgi:hypothetical protein